MRFRNGARSSDPLGLDLLGFHAFPLKGVAFSWLGLHDLGLQLRAFGGNVLGFRGSLGSEVFRDLGLWVWHGDADHLCSLLVLSFLLLFLNAATIYLLLVAEGCAALSPWALLERSLLQSTSRGILKA